MNLIEAEDTPPFAGQLRMNSRSQAQGSLATMTTTELAEEDVRDAEIARSALSRIGANPNSLVSGSELDKQITELLS
jgi:hypothetical protein